MTRPLNYWSHPFSVRTRTLIFSTNDSVFASLVVAPCHRCATTSPCLALSSPIVALAIRATSMSSSPSLYRRGTGYPCHLVSTAAIIVRPRCVTDKSTRCGDGVTSAYGRAGDANDRVDESHSVCWNTQKRIEINGDPVKH